MFDLLNVKQHQRVVILCILIVPFTSTYAEELKVDSKIKAITIYPGSAKITRVSTVSVNPGENDIVIKDLPLNLNESSLRITGKGSGSISLGSVELSRDIKEDVVQEDEKKLLDEIEDVEDKGKKIEDAISRNTDQLKYIKKVAFGSDAFNKKEEEIENNYTQQTDQWQEAWHVLDTETNRVQDEIRRSVKRKKNNDKVLNKLNRELKQIATNQKERRNAKLKVNSDSKSEITLNIIYQIAGARWQPVYDIDLDTKTGAIQLKTLAQINQHTGEDWEEVDITVSTLKASAGTQLPQLNPWVLDFVSNERSPVKPKSLKSEIVKNSVSLEDQVTTLMAAKKDQKLEEADLKQQQSRLIASDFTAEYKVPGLISLDSGNNKSRFTLNTQKLDSTIKLASAPRIDPRVMILATSKYEDETPLLSGSMSLYRDGNYVGNTFLQQKQSGEEIKLSFGEDDNVKIQFLPDPDKKRKDGLLFGKKKVVERHYKVNINSSHNKPYEITISDVLPTASDETIIVKNLGDKPSKKDVEDKKGIISWDKTLEPKTDIKIKYGYSVSYPEGQSIQGL